MTQPKTASKSTPGPWRWEFEAIEHGYEKLVGSNGFVVLIHSEEDGDIKEHDKSLIAKAPEMYELLEKVKKTIETAASKPDKQEVCAVLLEVVLPHLGEEARRIKAAIDGVKT